ncbi:unnamed protein product, partial [Staurois parvus]
PPQKVRSLWSSPLYRVPSPGAPCPQSLVHPVSVPCLWQSAVSGQPHPLYPRVRSLWSCPPVPCPQSLVIPCTVPAVSGHPLYRARSLWSTPVPCPQSLVNPCTVSAVSGHPLYQCPQSLVIPCTVSAVSGHPLYVSVSVNPTVSVSGHPLYCPQSLVISFTACSLWSS